MYERTHWLDHATVPSNRYNISQNEDGTYTITRAGTVAQQGTPQDQQHFNNIEIGITDAHAAALLLVNALRQTQWNVAEVEALVEQYKSVEVGFAALTNSLAYPFNDSRVSIPLTLPRGSVYYEVKAEVTEFDGNVGEVIVSDRLTNGFKLAYTGSAASATVKYIVTGGIAP